MITNLRERTPRPDRGVVAGRSFSPQGVRFAHKNTFCADDFASLTNLLAPVFRDAEALRIPGRLNRDRRAAEPTHGGGSALAIEPSPDSPWTFLSSEELCTCLPCVGGCSVPGRSAYLQACESLVGPRDGMNLAPSLAASQPRCRRWIPASTNLISCWHRSAVLILHTLPCRHVRVRYDGTFSYVKLG
jgi:hypothetical protein